jgi:hypothetical protein
MKRRIAVSFALVAALAASACNQRSNLTISSHVSSVLSAAQTGYGQLADTAQKAYICHRTGNGSYHLINVSGNAVAAHRDHGDGAPGEGVPGNPYLRFDNACRVSATFDPVADYDAGWLSGSNPNGVWRYGWSSTLASPLTLYSQNYTTTQDCGLSTYRVWNDPFNNASFTPAVIKNIGPTCSNGNVDIPTGVLTQHFGGLSGTDYSHVLFTAPFGGAHDVAITFTGRQNGLSTSVNVLVNGTSVLTGFMTANLQTVLYSATLALSAGDTIDFATGPGPFGPGHVGLSGTITAVP